MSTADPHTVAWTVDHVETAPLDPTDRDACVNNLAALIISWNEARPDV